MSRGSRDWRRASLKGRRREVSVRSIIGAPERRRGQHAPTTATAVKSAAALIAAATLALAAACSSGAASSQKAKAAPVIPAAQVTITPASGSKDVKPGAGITVTAARGKLTNVTVHTSGTQASGTFSHDGTVWRSNWTLGTSQRFVVTATAVNTAGRTVTAKSMFHTLSPQAIFQTQIFEGNGETYGVGMPIKLTFSRPITDKARVERSLELRTSKPVVGAWWWDGDQALDFRPKHFWPHHTTVWFTGHLDGVEGAPGVYGTADLTQKFHIGDALVARVSTSHHYMRVYRNGKHIYTWPISSGKPGDYNVKVYWSVRFTWSGDYIHSAPWSVGEQGSANVSHGCVNLGPSYAPIYYKMEVPGDPVLVSGSPLDGKWDDGWTDWFLSWPKMLSYSATKQAVQAGPNGSSFVDPDIGRRARRGRFGGAMS